VDDFTARPHFPTRNRVKHTRPAGYGSILSSPYVQRGRLYHLLTGGVTNGSPGS
jgi:hypothetical protein